MMYDFKRSLTPPPLLFFSAHLFPFSQPQRLYYKPSSFKHRQDNSFVKLVFEFLHAESQVNALCFIAGCAHQGMYEENSNYFYTTSDRSNEARETDRQTDR